MAKDKAVRADYSSGEVERLLGLTQRQLGYWAATHVVEPMESRGTGTGRRLRFSFDDLVRLSVIKRLLDAGMSLQAVRRSIEFLRTLPDVTEPLRDIYLTSDGRTIYAHQGADQVLDALRGGQMVLALGLEGVMKDLRTQIVELQALRQRKPAGRAKKIRSA
ncbi:MAG: MerR family transcriptional regulator [Chloroflexota bacterium]